ncbi:unnamed protein product [Musa banksii]
MGNCQAAEVATVVIQHPGGRVERLYWPTSAADVMKSNPGYHVALVTLYVSETKTDGGGGGAGTVRFTRVRLLKPRDMLLLGQVYRLITSQGSIRTASLPFPDSLLGSLISDSLPEVAKSSRKTRLNRSENSNSSSSMEQTISVQILLDRKQRRIQMPHIRYTYCRIMQSILHDMFQATNQERDRQKSRTQVAARGRHWRPSLQSISEAGS